jgi:CheY-like chemotaxis protein
MKIVQRVGKIAWKIFLADDDDDTRLLMGSALRRAGFVVIEASNGLELVERVKRDATPHVLVISDVGMPELDGIDAVHALKGVRPSMPVLLVTAFADSETIRRAHAVGVKLVLPKPVDFASLARAANELVREAS